MSKSVLIIGGSGLLGVALRRAFAGDARYEVSFSSTRGDPADPAHLKLDLLDSRETEQVRAFDILINLTGQVTEPFSRCLELNTAGIQNLIAAVRDGKQTLVQASTTLVYGTAETVNEESPLHPETPYASAKVQAEALLSDALPPVRLLIARLTNLYGPGQTKGLLWFLLQHVRRGTNIVITDNNGDLRRHFLHVEDAARLIHALVAADATGIVNVPGPEHYSIRDIVMLLGRITGKPPVAHYAGMPPTGNIGAIGMAVLARHVSVTYKHSVEAFLREELAKASI